MLEVLRRVAAIAIYSRTACGFQFKEEIAVITILTIRSRGINARQQINSPL